MAPVEEDCGAASPGARDGRALFEASPAVQVLLEPDTGQIVDANAAASSFYGSAAGSLLGRTLWALGPVGEAVCRQSIADTRGGRQVSFRSTHVDAAGRTRTVQVVLARVCVEGRGRVLAAIFDVTDRDQVEADRDRLLSAIEQVGETVVITDADGTMSYVNPTFEKITGFAPDEAIGKNPRILQSGEHDEHFYASMWSVISRGETWRGRFVNRRKDGRNYVEDAVISPVVDDAGRVVNYVAVKRDITRQLQLEAQLQQAQKLEAVGVLAAGVAHDFNNLLQVIKLGTEMALEEPGLDPSVRESLSEVALASRRAGRLVQQLLTFSRQHPVRLEPLDLNRVLSTLSGLVGASLGEHITVGIWLEADRALVEADEDMVEQALLNLCFNARDAMPDGGELAVESFEASFDSAFCRENPWARNGDWVGIRVRDSGTGMDPAVVQRIFEPFFTTKPVGKGTGLGLAAVHGIVMQHGGLIRVESAPGHGTSFELYFPQLSPADGDRAEAAGKPSQTPVSGGQEILLVAEDHTLIRQRLAALLSSAGYTVLTAEDGVHCIEVFREHARAIDLVVLDVVMPRLDGAQAFERMRDARPDLQALFLTGYALEDVLDVRLPDMPLGIDDDPGGADWTVLKKPCGRTDLLRAVRRLLDRQ